MQGLGALPEDLVIRILMASSIPLREQVHLLPSPFHAAAVHAAFPTMDADRSLCADASGLEDPPLAEALWPELSRITFFRRCNER